MDYFTDVMSMKVQTEIGKLIKNTASVEDVAHDATVNGNAYILLWS